MHWRRLNWLGTGFTEGCSSLSCGAALISAVLHQQMFVSFGMGLAWYESLGNRISWSWLLMKVCAYSVN